jgi:choline dehydrogenase-like flavoprotein
MLADLTSMAKSPGLLFKGLGMKLLESGSTPEWLKTAVVDTVLRFNPRLAVRERLSRGVPHKLLGVTIEGICEQRPDPDNRVLLSEIPDALGVPHPRVRWHVDPVSLRSMAQLGKLMAAEFARVGLPKPHLEDWVMDDDSAPPAVIDMAHTLGTTRMCNDPRKGVVDPNCRVHGVDGLYVAGGSVFATSGHANPTLMILGLAVRMADHIKQVMASQASGGMPPRFVQVKSAAP